MSRQSWLSALRLWFDRLRTASPLWRRHAPEPDEKNAQLGRAGEAAAERHLRDNGYRVLARNWRNPDDAREEIDLVCLAPAHPGDRERPLIFVEVKARAAGARVSGYHAVTPRKKRALLRACQAYLSRLRPMPRHYRFDIVEVFHGADARTELEFAALKLPSALFSRQDGRIIIQHTAVPFFPDRTRHRHDRHE